MMKRGASLPSRDALRKLASANSGPHHVYLRDATDEDEVGGRVNTVVRPEPLGHRSDGPPRSV